MIKHLDLTEDEVMFVYLDLNASSLSFCGLSNTTSFLPYLPSIIHSLPPPLPYPYFPLIFSFPTFPPSCTPFHLPYLYSIIHSLLPYHPLNFLFFPPFLHHAFPHSLPSPYFPLLFSFPAFPLVHCLILYFHRRLPSFFPSYAVKIQ